MPLTAKFRRNMLNSASPFEKASRQTTADDSESSAATNAADVSSLAIRRPTHTARPITFRLSRLQAVQVG